MWTPSEKEIAAIVRLSPEQRYRHLLKKIADIEAIYGLWSDGWVVIKDDNDNDVVPIWPHRLYADLCANRVHAQSSVREVDLYDWMQRALPEFEQAKYQIAAFPVVDDGGLLVSAASFVIDLNEELSQY